jgi:MoxR-like ATPase
MSRLHLLQGISGIGKTSLPRDFAAAIDAECVVVPVAAEWRSPQDLMGYYNSFERRFYESAFTKALYKAQQPLYVSKPFLIVLDEMNLSHPEQYFSDVLAALELPPSGEPQKLVLELMSGRVDPAPRLFEDGYKLVIPDNVWFIGTANQDETTVAFADKTYDRAHITELPARPTRFTAETVEQIRPFSTRALTTRFTQAQAKHQTEIELVKSFLEALSDFTRTEFGFTTAPRLLDRQLEKFVSTVIAAGGSPAEAADHLAATKLLRKFHGRVEIRKDRLKPMLDRLNDEWHIFDVDPVPDGNEKWPEPQESLTVINNEIRDRDGW